MKIVLFAHPEFIGSQSMPRFAAMLKSEYEKRGYGVTVWAPQPRFFNLMPFKRLKKWAGYVDQYFIFPFLVKFKLGSLPADTIFVFCDNALGPWIPLVANKPHVVHANDLLALRSAWGHFPENPTAWSGRKYQQFIFHGFRNARNFIAISHKTRDDLRNVCNLKQANIDVVYLGLNFPYRPLGTEEARSALVNHSVNVPESGMLIHISGRQWYKNFQGIVEIYSAYVKLVSEPLPLLCIGPMPNERELEWLSQIPPKGHVLFRQDFDNHSLQAAYSLSRVLLFPSHEEGFGWPIIEAQACGCLVITTNAAPMNEIAGPVARIIPRLQYDEDKNIWAEHGAAEIKALLELSEEGRARLVTEAREWVRRFSTDEAIESYLKIYDRIVRDHG